MARCHEDWDDLAQNIQQIVDQAVSSQDYRKLNQTITQTVNRAVDIGSEAVRKAVDGVVRPAGKEAEKPVPVETKRNLPVLYGSTNGKTAQGIVKIVGGSVLSGCAFLFFLGSMILALTGIPTLGAVATVLTLGAFGAGIGLLASGIRTLGWVGRFKIYRKTLGEKTHCTLERLARNAGKNVKFVRKELRQMIDAGLFLEGHLDNEEKTLITSEETFQNFERSRLAMEERQRLEAAAEEQAAQERAARKMQEQAQDPRVREVLDKGNAFIAEIRRCNDAIPGLEISEKISRMETIVQRIFARAKAHPEIVPDLKKLMDYYLPMTVKLLNAYAEMDAQPIQGDNIEGAKREIEATLDTLNLAFEKLLDSVFKDTAMDVSSDISVLNTLLAQEGLTEDGFSQMKNQQ